MLRSSFLVWLWMSAGLTLVVAAPARAEVVWGAAGVTTTSVAGCPGSPGFGQALSVRGDTFAIGADRDCTGDLAERGAAVVYDRLGGAWVQSEVVFGPAGAAGDRFGAQVYLGDGTLAVGSPGAAGGAGVAEVYVRLGLRFRSVGTLSLPPSAPVGTAPAGLGTALVADASTVVAGAPGLAPEGLAGAGGVVVFERDTAGAWAYSQLIFAPTPTAGDGFGAALALGDTYVAVTSASGVELFERRAVGDALVWVQSLPMSGATGVDMVGNTLVVSRVGASSGISVFAPGPDEVFVATAAATTAAPTSGPVAIGAAGVAVATTGGVEYFVKGATGYASDGVIAGSSFSVRALRVDDEGVYVAGDDDLVQVHRRVATNGEACGTAGECESGFCIDGVCCATACGGGQADCRACSVALGSTSDGVCTIVEAGTVCRGQVGECDKPDVCDGVGGECPIDRLEPQGTPCREAVGVCDVAEQCNGVSPFCPDDAVEPVGIPCRSAAGLCDVPEACNGVEPHCPPDRVVVAGRACRERLGPCDEEEACDGASPRCPRDVFKHYGFVCRPAGAACDAPEVCSGFDAPCPVDVLAEDGAPCADGDGCTVNDQCLGGVCAPGPDECAGADATAGADASGDDTVGADEDTAPAASAPRSGGCVGGGEDAALFWVLGLFAWVLARRRAIARWAAPVAVLALVAGWASPAAAQDADGDGVLDAADKCLGPDGTDEDVDGWPSGCDCDDDDGDVHPGAKDVCNVVDDDCDGRLDVNTALNVTGGQMFSELGEAAANRSSRTLSVTANGQRLHASTASSGSGYDIFYARPVELYNAGDARTVRVRFVTPFDGASPYVRVGFTDGARVVGVATSPFFSATIPVFEAGTYNAGAASWTRKTSNARFAALEDALSVTITSTPGQTTVQLATGAGTQSYTVPSAYTLDPTAAWELIVSGGTKSTVADVDELLVYQDLPARDAAADSDGDGFPETCDCDDADPDVYPGALDLCDGVDQDCGGDGDGLTYLRFPGVGILSEVTQGTGVNPSARTLTARGEEVEVGPGAGEAGDVFYRRRVPVLGLSAGQRSRVTVHVARDPEAGDHDLRVGLSDGTHVLAVGLSDTGDGDGTLVAVGPRWGDDETSRVTHEGVGGTDVLADDGDFALTFDMGTTSRLTVTNGAGLVLSRDFPASAPSLDFSQPLRVVLYADEAEETYRIRRLAVTQGPLDADADGVCDAADRCIGDDGAPDADHDGYPATCDCDDTRANVHPGGGEVCDAVDQDCDGRGDDQRLAGARGSELLGRVAAGMAENPSGAPTYALLGGQAVLLPAREGEHAVVYREAVTGLRSEDPLTLTAELSFDAGQSASRGLTVALSDGARAVGATVVMRVPSGGGAARPQADAVYAADGDDHLSPDGGGTRVDRSVTTLTTVRLTYTILVEGAATLGVALVDPALEAPVADVYTIPDAARFDVAAPLSLVVVAPDPATAYELTDVRVAQALADADQDGVCDGRDRCPGADDTMDGDRDGVPDACDLCLGPDGTADLDGDGFPAGCDCDDASAARHPDAEDTCNGVDDDCDAVTDRSTALRVRGAEMVARVAAGRATGGARLGVARAGGDAVEFPTYVGPDLDVYYREALALLPSFGIERRLRIVVDRDSHTGDHDFLVAVSDGLHVYGLGLYDVGGTGTRYLAAPVVGTDEGATVTLAVGAGKELTDASPYTLDVTLGADPRVDVTTASGETVTVKGGIAADGGRVGTGSLTLLLIGQQPSERYVVRSLRVSQELADADGDQVCDAIDFCPGEDDRGVDSDGDGIVDPCDVCPLGDDRRDGDGDGVPDACDACDGADDAVDADHDGLPDGCDDCPDDPTNDYDQDGVCDRSDRCLDGDDNLDADADGVPDACDPCPLDAEDDSDEDGTCDAADVCQGDDRSGDRDGDGVCGDRDCDDTRAHVHPGAAEVCDGFDSDCDGALGPGELDTDGDYVIQCKQAPVVDPGADDTPTSEGDSGCAGGAAPPPSWLLVAALLLVLRRRRADRAS